MTTLFKGSTGLNTRSDPSRIGFNSETGVSDLALAVNVIVDDSMRVSRRGGYTSISSTAYHSPLPLDSLSFLAISGTDLRLVYTDATYQSLATVTQGARTDYLKVGSKIMYCNGYENGLIENATRSAWSVGTYHGPSRSKVFEAPPVGTLLAYFAGCVWIAERNVLWHSEPYSLNLFDKSKGFFYYESDITMIEPVSHGIYVSTEDRIIFLAGKTPEGMEENTLTDYPAIKGTAVKVSGTVLGGDHRQQNMVTIFTTTKGICLGGQTFDNLTQDKFDYPLAHEGCATMIDNIYVVNLYK